MTCSDSLPCCTTSTVRGQSAPNTSEGPTLRDRSGFQTVGYAMMFRVDELRTDRPTAVELLEIMAATLKETVVPATAPKAQHQARVIANLCRVLGRELAANETVTVPIPPSLRDVDDATADAAYGDVLELVRAKLAVNKPGYDAHSATQERNIIA